MAIGVDLFSGAGGLSLGAEMAGIEVRMAVEIDRCSAETYRSNHTGTTVVEDDIHNVKPLDFIALHPNEKVTIVFGGPPCQGFSTSNTMTRNMQNPNNSLFEEFLRFVSELSPDWFLFENVEGFLRFENGKIVKIVEQCFKELGYQVKHRVLWASDYGVPQRRNRFFMVGNRHGIDFLFPKAFGTKITVEDAINDLPDLENGQMDDVLPYKTSVRNASIYARAMRKGSRRSRQNYVSRNEDYVIERYRYIKQGENWRSIPEELMKNYANKENCHSGIYKRLVANEPSIVISNYRKNMLIHPHQDRGLSVREAARLQSFPDTFLFSGSLMHIQQQIGNAVPPLLAKAVFERIMEYDRNILR